MIKEIVISLVIIIAIFTFGTVYPNDVYMQESKDFYNLYYSCIVISIKNCDQTEKCYLRCSKQSGYALDEFLIELKNCSSIFELNYYPVKLKSKAEKAGE